MSNLPPLDYLAAAGRWFGRSSEHLDAAARKVLDRAAHRRLLSEDLNHALDAQSSFGERLADRVARFGGSWTFISLFGVVLALWVGLNAGVLGRDAFDPYPFIFLNLVLSMLAAIQAPIIMMSQNRQSAKDRQMVAHDYEVNLKAEIEILALHEKVDALRAEQWQALVAQQQVQIELLTRLLGRASGGERAG